MRDVSTSYLSATICVRYVWNKQGGHDTALVLVDATVTGYGQGRFAYFYSWLEFELRIGWSMEPWTFVVSRSRSVSR